MKKHTDLGGPPGGPKRPSGGPEPENVRFVQDPYEKHTDLGGHRAAQKALQGGPENVRFVQDPYEETHGIRRPLGSPKGPWAADSRKRPLSTGAK